jgi:hypothetical protein
VLEVAIPLKAIEAAAGTPVAFYVSASLPGTANADGERYPAQRAIQLEVPGGTFSGDNWRA